MKKKTLKKQKLIKAIQTKDLGTRKK